MSSGRTLAAFIRRAELDCIGKPTPERLTQIKVVCSRCGVVVQDGALDAEGRVSHGLCSECEQVTRDEWGLPRKVQP